MSNLKQRPLKFRAWNGEAMEYGGFSIHASCGIIPAAGLTSAKEDSPLMQFSGLYDKGNNPIYEGDIVKFRSHPEKQRVGLIRWHETTARFYISIPDEISIRGIRVNDQFEVIGNIHQNKELLEDK